MVSKKKGPGGSISRTAGIGGAEFLQTLIDHIPLPVFYKDVSGRYLGCNAAFEEWFGIKRKDIAGKTVYEINPKYLADKYAEMDDRLFSDHKIPQVYESSVQPISGERKNVCFYKSAYYGPRGDVEGLIGVVLDITDRKKAEERWKIFQTFVEASGQGFGIAGLDGKISYMNHTLANMLSIREPSSALGHDISTIFPDAEAERLRTAVIPSIDEGKQWFGEMSLKGLSGDTVPVIGNFFRMAGSGDTPDSYAFVFTNISDRKMMEAERQELLKRSMAALSEAKVERERSETANKLKVEFLANMSHELRTPLSSVIGFSKLNSRHLKKVLGKLENIAKLLAEGIASGGLSGGLDRGIAEDIAALNSDAMVGLVKSANFVEVAVSQGEKLLDLINDLLDLSMVESGSMNLQKQSVSAKILMASVLSALAANAKEKGLSLVTNKQDFSDCDLQFVGDKKRLEQIMQNLVDNAIKYSDGGTVGVSIRPAGDVLSIEVSDEGIGIPEAELNNIFERFHQVDGSITRHRGGVGLGLSLVKKLVVLMGGEIGVESEFGKGTTFRVNLPLVHAEKKIALPVEENDLSRINGKDILIIDDDMNTVDVLGEFFRGNSVSGAINGKEGRDALLGRKFDLIILDLHMPKMSGVEFLEHLPDGYSVPVIVLTDDLMMDSAGEVERVAARKELKLEFASKPFSIPDLKQRMVKLGLATQAGTARKGDANGRG